AGRQEAAPAAGRRTSPCAGRRTTPDPGRPPASHPGRRAAAADRPVAPATAAGRTAGTADRTAGTAGAEARTRIPRDRIAVAPRVTPTAATWTAARRGPLATAPSMAGTAGCCRRSAGRRPGRTEIPAVRGVRTPGYGNQLHRP